MTVTAKNLVGSQFVTNADATIYTAPPSVKTIIDKLTGTNTDASAQTLTLRLVPSGQSAGTSNTILSAFSIAAGVTKDFTELQNHILSPGDFISVVASVASKIVIRASGREIA